MSIEDEDDDTTWMIDVDFIKSSYQCIFGNGCKSIDAEPNSEHGCCSFGAHFADDEDRQETQQYIDRLTPDVWEKHDIAQSLGGPIDYSEEFGATKVYDGACIFLNSSNFENGHGCALHLAALVDGKRPLDYKPMVCWQVPVRMDLFEDDYGHTTATIRPWQRRDWDEGGQEFNWWCTESDEAYSSSTWVYTSLRDELIELMGEEIYAKLGEQIRVEENRFTPVQLLKKTS